MEKYSNDMVKMVINSI